METLLLKMMLSWAIMIIAFVALFSACNNGPVEKQNAGDETLHDTAATTVPDNTRTDGILQKHASDTAAAVQSE